MSRLSMLMLVALAVPVVMAKDVAIVAPADGTEFCALQPEHQAFLAKDRAGRRAQFLDKAWRAHIVKDVTSKPLPLKRRYTLTGVRVGNALHLYVDGQLIANRLISQGILAPRQPLRLVVGNNVKGEVRNVTGGLGWPTWIARPPTVSEIFGE